MFLANYGLVELAAIGLVDAVFGVALFASLGLVDGIQIVIGRRAGQQKPAEIGRVFNQGVYLLTLASGALILVILYVLPVVLAEVLASGEIFAALEAHLRISAYQLLFQSFNLAFSAFYVGISRTGVLIGATVILALTNIVLNYGLIFGNLGLPELGIQGAAIASLSAEIAAFAFLLLDVLRQQYPKQYGLGRFSHWNWGVIKPLLTISAPVSMETLVETGK